MKHIIFLLIFCLLVTGVSIPALAVDSYHFTTTDTEAFYQSGVATVTYEGAIPGYVQQLYDFTPQSIHTSEYGATIIAPERDAGYGLASERPAYALGSNGEISPAGRLGGYAGGLVPPARNTVSELANEPTFSAENVCFLEDVRQSDGSIGTLKIPAIGLTVTAWEGEATAAMKKGVGLIDSTSAWLGNVGLIGHNRGASTVFSKLKSLKVSDEITYTTALGSRTYTVSAVEKISATDWSLLQYTTDNRITLVTCVEDAPQYRLAVQACEKR